MLITLKYQLSPENLPFDLGKSQFLSGINMQSWRGSRAIPECLSHLDLEMVLIPHSLPQALNSEFSIFSFTFQQVNIQAVPVPIHHTVTGLNTLLLVLQTLRGAAI